MDLPLDYIFIDTSVFQSSSYFKSVGHVDRLFELAEKGYVSVIMPAITEKEWQDHYEEATRISFDQIQRKLNLCGKSPDAFLSKYSTIGSDYDSHIKDAFKAQMNRAKVIRLPLEHAADQITKVFEKYYSRKKPFGSEKKKSEFPDAFVLASLEKYAEENHLGRIIVISDDNDMIGYESSLLMPKDAKEFLDEITQKRIPQFTGQQQAKADQDTSRLSLYFQTQPASVLTHISSKVMDFLKDRTVYADRLNYADVKDIAVPHLFLSIDANGMEVLSIDEQTIEASIPVHVDVKVKVTHFDEENSIWDSEDKDYLIKLDTTTDIPISCVCPLAIVYSRPEQTDEEGNVLDTDIEFEEIDLSNLQDAINESKPVNEMWRYKCDPELDKSVRNFLQHLPPEYLVDLSKYGLLADNKWQEFSRKQKELLHEYFGATPNVYVDTYERIKALHDRLVPKTPSLLNFNKYYYHSGQPGGPDFGTSKKKK